VTPCNLVSVCRRSEDCAVFVFRVENGESSFLQNVEKCYSDYTASHYARYLSLLMNGLLIWEKINTFGQDLHPEFPRAWISNPRPAWLYFEARGQICKLSMRYKNVTVNYEVTRTTYCYFSTCGPRTNTQCVWSFAIKRLEIHGLRKYGGINLKVSHRHLCRNC